MQLSGTLYTYYEEDRLTAFESGDINSPNSVVFIGGLGDGYNAVPFLEPLTTALSEIGWSLIQVQLTSSYTGYGFSSLQKDSTELDYLVQYLKDTRKKQKIVFLGHSTGSQDCYWHNKNGKMNSSVLGYILQAPVSDRECGYKVEPNFGEQVELATKMRKEGNGGEFLPRKYWDTPMTADRLYSLGAFGGDDDVFSSDLPDDMIERLYKGMERPMAMLHSKDDECYGSSMDPMELMKRYQSFCPAFKKLGLLDNGGHSVTTKEGQDQLCEFVLEFIREIENN